MQSCSPSAASTAAAAHGCPAPVASAQRQTAANSSASVATIAPSRCVKWMATRAG